MKESSLNRIFKKTYTSFEFIEDAGQPFVVDMDSLLLDSLGSAGLDWSYGPQLSQLLYQFELRLEWLGQAGRRFTLMIFDAMRAAWRRPSHVLAREILVQHLSTNLRTKIAVRRFTDWENEDYSAFLKAVHPSFALVSPNGDPVARLLSPNAKDLLRRHTMHLLASGIRVVRARQITVEDTRLKGFQQLARDSAIAAYQSLELPALPKPEYDGIFSSGQPSFLGQTEGKTVELIKSKLAGLPEGLIVAAACLVDTWKMGTSAVHERFFEIEKECESKLRVQGSLDRFNTRTGARDDDDDDSEDDEWDGKGLGAAEDEKKEKGKEETDEQSSQQDAKALEDIAAAEEAWARAQAGNEDGDAEDGFGDGDDDVAEDWDDDDDAPADDWDNDGGGDDNGGEGADDAPEDWDTPNDGGAAEEEGPSSEGWEEGGVQGGDDGKAAPASDSNERARKVWAAVRKSTVSAAFEDCPEDALIKVSLLHCLLSHHLPLEDRNRRLPVIPGNDPNASLPGPSNLGKGYCNPRVFLELYSAQLAKYVMSPLHNVTACGEASPLIYAVDGALFHRTLALAWASRGATTATAALGLPTDLQATLDRLWAAFSTEAGMAKPIGRIFPILPAGIKPNDDGLSSALEDLTKALEGKSTKSDRGPDRTVLFPVESPLIDCMFSEQEKNVLKTYTTTEGGAAAKSSDGLYWLPPDPLSADPEDDLALLDENLQRRELLERKKREKLAAAKKVDVGGDESQPGQKGPPGGPAVTSNQKTNAETAKPWEDKDYNSSTGGLAKEGLTVKGSKKNADEPTAEQKQLQENQLYLLFMTKYAQSLSGTKLVLRDLIVASSNANGSGRSGGWQGSGGKGGKGGWNPSGKKGKKGKRAGAGKAMVEQIKAGVDARNSEKVKADVASYIAAARRIRLTPKLSEAEKKRREEEELGISFAPASGDPAKDEDDEEDGKQKERKTEVSTISLNALEKRIEFLDEKLVAISDPNVIPGLLTLLDWCVLAWCEQQRPGSSFKLPTPDGCVDGDDEDESDDVNVKDEDEKTGERDRADNRNEGSRHAFDEPKDTEMARAVRTFHVAFDVFRRFKQDLNLEQLARVLSALCTLGFTAQANQLLEEYANVRRVKIKDIVRRAAAKFKESDLQPREGAVGYKDEIFARSIELLHALGLSLIRPRNEGLMDGDDEDSEEEDDEESEEEESGKRGKEILSRKERESRKRQRKAQREEAKRRYRQLCVAINRVSMDSARFQLMYGGPKMVRDVQSAPDPRVTGFYPDAWQRKMLDIVDRRGSALIVAPTSSGKTFASYYAMKKILTFNRQSKAASGGFKTGSAGGPFLVVYVCPTTALVNQVAAGVYRRYGAVFGVLTPGERYRTSSCEVLVTLPHMLEEIMLSPEREDWVARVKYVIYDEVHSLDGSGGGAWERLLAAFPAPFLALSATVGNPEAFHAWLCRTRSKTAAVPALRDALAEERVGAKPVAANSKKRGGKRGSKRDKAVSEEKEGEGSKFSNDNPEVELIVHKKRWADLEKLVYIPNAGRDATLLCYKHGIQVPKTKAEKALLLASGRRVPKLPPSGLQPFHPLATMSFGARAQMSGSGQASPSTATAEIPDTIEFSPRDAIVLYDRMVAVAKVETAGGPSSKELKALDPSVYFRGSPYIGRDAATAFGERVKAAYSKWAGVTGANTEQKSKPPTLKVLDQLAMPIQFGLSALRERKEVISSRNFVIRYTLPLLVDLARENKLPAVGFCMDPNLCETLTRTVLEALEKLEEAAQNREGSSAEKRRLRKEALRARRTEKRMRDKKGRDPPITAGSGKSKQKLSHDDIARANAAREARRQHDDAVRATAAKLDQDEIDELMGVDPRFAFIHETERILREDLDFWLDRLRKETGWPVHHPLLRALWRGIGVHHEGLPRTYKDLVETMFRAKNLKVVISTGTLAVGVNMPSRTTAFLGDSPLLTPLAFRQMAGRAGRRGHDDVGYVAFLGVPMQKVASLMASPLTSLRGRVPGSPTLTLRMTIFQNRAKDQSRATKLLANLLSTPPLELPGAALAERQARFAFRFEVERLRRLRLVDGCANPEGLAGIAAMLHSAGPGALTLCTLIRSGALRRVCGGPKRFRANPDGSARRLMFVLCHLFHRLPLPADVERSQFKRSSSTVVLAPLPPRIAREVRALDEDALRLISLSFGAFSSTLPARGSTKEDAESAAKAANAAVSDTAIRSSNKQKPVEKAEPKKAKKLSKKEKKRLEVLKRLQKNTQSTPQSTSKASVQTEPALRMIPLPAVPFGALPLSGCQVAKLPADSLTPDAGALSIVSVLREKLQTEQKGSLRCEVAGSVGAGEDAFLSSAEARDGVAWGITAQQTNMAILGGGPGSDPDRLESIIYGCEGRDEKYSEPWDGPRLNAYALDFLKHGQLPILVKDNRVPAGRAWTLLRDWNLLLTALARAVSTMKRAPDYAPTFVELARRFRKKFQTLSAMG
eukprot:CAMPEP_0114531348 /NCGR_PEP_ID=MMETSP0109-20121206/26009_1 /TAXON_ID=29199 /ORGANISM="Chlorarachnion reptans, Strain CCCM449" /LENGTH=2464 /DNA_ID=CAMNT_0001714189 /DNA_START=104 /DNA_END=7498 /DNA_ORIENTATION=-